MKNNTSKTALIFILLRYYFENKGQNEKGECEIYYEQENNNVWIANTFYLATPANIDEIIEEIDFIFDWYKDARIRIIDKITGKKIIELQKFYDK